MYLVRRGWQTGGLQLFLATSGNGKGPKGAMAQLAVMAAECQIRTDTTARLSSLKCLSVLQAPAAASGRRIRSRRPASLGREGNLAAGVLHLDRKRLGLHCRSHVLGGCEPQEEKERCQERAQKHRVHHGQSLGVAHALAQWRLFLLTIIEAYLQHVLQ